MNDCAVLTISVKELSPKKTQLWGATLGKAHAASLESRLQEVNLGDPAIFLLDFSGIDATSPSYLKQLLTPLLGPKSGERAVALISNLSDDVREDLAVFLSQRRWVMREVSASGAKVFPLTFVGELETTALETLCALEEAKEATAADLHQKCPDLKIAQTAWSNRLANLHELLLAVRIKVGRVWIYKSTIEI